MKENSKPRLVIGSVLRPVDDHRMYEKLGIAFAELDKHEVHIVGSRSQGAVRNKNIRFHALFDCNRMSVERFIAPILFLKKVIQLKPEVLIVNSPDLLIVAICYKILFGKTIVYDVLENYYANIMFANTFKPFVRRVLSSAVRLLEQMSRPFVAEYWLAERIYEAELPFVKDKYRLVENRFPMLGDVRVCPRRGIHRLLYSGTIAEAYGVFDAIELVKRLHKSDMRFSLTIIGFAAQPSVQERLFMAIEGLDFINLVGITHYVSHYEIMHYIAISDIGLLPYQVNSAVVNRIPTKFYEYLAFSLPFIVSPNPFWKEITLPYSSLVSFLDFRISSEVEFMDTLYSSLCITNFHSLDINYFTTIISNFYEDIY